MPTFFVLIQGLSHAKHFILTIASITKSPCQVNVPNKYLHQTPISKAIIKTFALFSKYHNPTHFFRQARSKDSLKETYPLIHLSGAPPQPSPPSQQYATHLNVKCVIWKIGNHTHYIAWILAKWKHRTYFKHYVSKRFKMIFR